jgi:hypothetical protein
MGENEGKDWAGPVAGGGDDEISDGNDNVGEAIGTLRLEVTSVDTFSPDSAGFGIDLYSHSEGISSAGGMGIPRAAAMS